MFAGRSLLIASKHKKELVLAPLLSASLGLHCQTAEDFDTDLLGTFSGETARKWDAHTTARQKCLQAMELYGSDLCIASEGSFGPHPGLFMLTANEELLLLIDKRHKLEIAASSISLETNFSGEHILSENQLMSFAKRAQFPSHALILRQSKDELIDLYKGISDWRELWAIYMRLTEKYGSCYAQTDMRALYNPSRMKVIEKTCQQLVQKMLSTCPACNTPGYSVSEVNAGLPCASCMAPTLSALSQIYTCQHCPFSHEEMYPEQKYTESPMYCQRCNP